MVCSGQFFGEENFHPSEMQQKRNIRLLISFGVLFIATISVFISFNKESQVVVDKNLFRVADFTKIDKVILKKEGQPVELKFDGARWKVNGQLADRNMIDVLFAALQQAEPKRPVAESMQDSISTMLKKEGVKVSLYSTDILQMGFIAGGNLNKTQAYFESPIENESYVIVIPGYRVYASGIFELDENGWKDKYVFNFNWRNFQTLRASFPYNPKSDFEVTMGKVYFEVRGGTSVDTTKLNDFLDAVSLLTVDRYVKKEEVSEYDSLLKTKPVLELQVSDVSGKSYSLWVYESGSETSVLGIIQGTQPAFFDRRKLTGVFKTRNWFVKN